MNPFITELNEKSLLIPVTKPGEGDSTKNEEKTSTNISAAIGDDLRLSLTLDKLERKEKSLDKRLKEINNLKERFKEVKHCGIQKSQYLKALDSQKKKLDEYNQQLLEEYDKLFMKEKEKIDCIPDDLVPENYKEELMKMKKTVMIKLIEAELEAKKSSDWSIKKLVKTNTNLKNKKRKQTLGKSNLF